MLNFSFLIVVKLHTLKELVVSSKDAPFFPTGMASWSNYIFHDIPARAIRGKALCYSERCNFPGTPAKWRYHDKIKKCL